MAHPSHDQVAEVSKESETPCVPQTNSMVTTKNTASCESETDLRLPPPVTSGKLLPFFILENKLSQLEISQYQSTIMAVCNSGSYLIEEFGCLFFFKLLAGTNKRMHVPIAPFKEHIRFCLPKNYFSNLVDIFMCRQTKTWC